MSLAQDGQGRYVIGSASDLWTLMNDSANYASANFIQTADVDMQNYACTPMWPYQTPFTGKYDGGGYSISNVVMNGEERLALIGGLDGTLCNIRMAGNWQMLGTDNFNAGLVSYFIGGTIRDIEISPGASVEVSGSGGSGAIVGYVGTTTGQIYNIDAHGSITIASTYNPIGGLVGQLGTYDIHAVKMHSTATVNLTSPSMAGVVLGKCPKFQVGSDPCNVTNIVSTCNVVMNCEYRAGGIAGLCNGNSNFEDCYIAHKGDFTGNYVGGILGQSNYLRDNDNTISLKRVVCAMEGDIIATGHKKSGGFVGFGVGGTLITEDCYIAMRGNIQDGRIHLGGSDNTGQTTTTSYIDVSSPVTVNGVSPSPPAMDTLTTHDFSSGAPAWSADGTYFDAPEGLVPDGARTIDGVKYAKYPSDGPPVIEVGPVSSFSAGVEWTAISGAVGYRVTLTLDADGSTQSEDVGSSVSHSFSTLQATTAYTVSLQFRTEADGAWEESSMDPVPFTTKNLAEITKDDILQRGNSYDFRQINMADIPSALTGFFGNLDSVIIRAGGEDLYARFVPRNETVILKKNSKFLLPFDLDDGAGQKFDMDIGTETVEISFDEAANTVSFGGDVVEVDGSIVFGGQRVTVLETS